MSTDPEIFRELGPTVARLLAELVDSDDPPDSSLLEWHWLAPRGNSASKLAMMTQDSIPLSARPSATPLVGLGPSGPLARPT